MKFRAEPVDVGGADFHRHAAPIDIVLSGHVELRYPLYESSTLLGLGESLATERPVGSPVCFAGLGGTSVTEFEAAARCQGV